MIHLIGNTAGTGSSLLSQILHRHSAVFSGDETHLFAKRDLYQRWSQTRDRISASGWRALRSQSWHMYNGIDLSDLTDISELDFQRFIDFRTFVQWLVMQVPEAGAEPIWVEKTPGNIYHIGDFLDHFPEGKFIFLVRQPLDNVASMIHRGMSTFHAVARYLCDNAVALPYHDHARLLMVRYEDLTTDPFRVVHDICTFLGVDFQEDMLASKTSDVSMDGWRFAEDGPVAANKKRFDQLTRNQKNEIYAGIHLIRTNAMSNLFKGHHSYSVEYVADHLSYKIDVPKPSRLSHFAKRFRNEMIKDRMRRMLRTYPNFGINYPIKISKS